MSRKEKSGAGPELSRWRFLFRLGWEAGNLAFAGALVYAVFLGACLHLSADQMAEFLAGGAAIIPLALAADIGLGLMVILPIYRGLGPLAAGEPVSPEDARDLWRRLIRYPGRALQVSMLMWAAGTVFLAGWTVDHGVVAGRDALRVFASCALLGMASAIGYYFRARVIIRPVLAIIAERMEGDFPGARGSIRRKVVGGLAFMLLAAAISMGVLAWQWRDWGRREQALALGRLLVAELGRAPDPAALAARDYGSFSVEPFLVDVEGRRAGGRLSAAELQFINTDPRLLGGPLYTSAYPARAALTTLLARLTPLPEAAALPGGADEPAWVLIQREPGAGGVHPGAVVRWRPRSVEESSADAGSLFLLLAVIAAIVGAMGLYGMWLADDLTGPLRRLRDTVDQTSAAAAPARAHSETDDEIGELAGSFNRMGRIIEDQLNRSSRIIAGIGQAAERLNEIMIRMVQVVAEQAAASTSHAVTVQQISTTSEEMAATLRMIAESAKGMDEVAGMTLSASHQGQRHLGEATTGINEAVARIRDVAGKMIFFQEQAGRIEGILHFIGDLSSRINLIALNASIEASSLGAGGERFAIVAQQMRDLAEKSMTGAKEIQSLFTDVQTASAGAIIATEEGEKQVLRAQGLTDRASDDFQSIVHWAGETARAVQEIALSSKQQTSATDHLATALADIRDAAAKIADAAQVLENSVNELDNTSYQLNQLLASDETGAGADRPRQGEEHDQQRSESEGADGPG